MLFFVRSRKIWLYIWIIFYQKLNKKIIMHVKSSWNNKLICFQIIWKFISGHNISFLQKIGKDKFIKWKYTA